MNLHNIIVSDDNQLMFGIHFTCVNRRHLTGSMLNQ